MEQKDKGDRDQSGFSLVFVDRSDDGRWFIAGDADAADSSFVFDLEDLAILGNADGKAEEPRY